MLDIIQIMYIKASSSIDASMQILKIVASSDYKYATNKGNRYGHIFVYFSVEHCKFFFEIQQRKHSTEMIKMFSGNVDIDEIVYIAACKYRFSQIAVGAILSRKIMSPLEFFAIAKEHFEWV